MKAILLAAGRGKRLCPITDSVPKVLAPLNGRPLLDYWLELCQAGGINEVLINGHYLAEQIETFVKHAQSRYRTKINFVYEEKLYGTGGTVKRCRDFMKGEEFFFFCHSDNFTNIDLKRFIDFHRRCKTNLSIALFKTNLPTQCGIVGEIMDNGLITEFTEKPLKPKSNLASAAMFIMSPLLIDERFPEKEYIDFSKEILPHMVGKMYGYSMNGFNIDIGTPQNYALANQIAKSWYDLREMETELL